MQSHLHRGAAGRGLVQGPSRRTCAPIAQLGAQPNPLSGAPAPVPITPLAAASSSSPSFLTPSTSSSSSANPTQRLILGPQPASSNGRGRLVLPGRASPSAVHVAAAPLRSSTAAPGPSSSGSSSSTTTTVQHDSKGSPIIYFGNQRVHSLTDTGREVIHSMSGWAETTLPRYLKPAEVNWQPQDLLPESSSDTFFDEVAHLRANAASLPDDYLVVLVGDMITEEALPSYMNMLNLLDETKDETGASPSPWAAWTRAWTGEENRHGDLLNRYLYLSGRVDMRRIEESVQRLIGSGLDPKLENNPYLCFVYTSFQERATRISHGNTARLAMYHGDRALAKICGLIAADEARHEAAYTAIVSEFLARDPEGALLAFEDMMKKGILMPAHYVDDGWHAGANNGQNLFVDYATVADSIGVYTTQDYAAIVDHLVKKWDIANLQGLSGRAAEAQEYLCKHSERIRRLADLQMERRLREKKRGRSRSAAFSWIFGKEVSLV